jgi:hypothetical protein
VLAIRANQIHAVSRRRCRARSAPKKLIKPPMHDRRGIANVELLSGGDHDDAYAYRYVMCAVG